MKHIIAVLLVVLMVAGMSVGCAKGGAENDKVTVAVVVAGGLGDRSFYDSANGGLEKLISEYGVEGKVIECKQDPSMYKQQLINASDTADFVVAVGWEFWDALTEIAPQLPDTKFIYVDQAFADVPNVFSIEYAQNEGSFLVGYIAGKLTKTNKIGAVGGEDSDVINDFFVGYEQGAKYANPECQAEFIYAGDYEDPAKGKECALTLFGKECDIVFQVAGKTGEGVFEAAAEQKGYAIGVDGDQKYINPDVIICSMKKEVGNSIFRTVADFIDKGVWKGGEVWTADMASGFVDVGYGEADMTQQVSDELKAEIETIKEKIISGEIVVNTKRG
ncbi:MAG: BMP family ABC transporter substrate-binding protein [Clostridia bacterium]